VTTQQPAHEGAPRRFTSAVLSGGVAVAGVLFAAAMILEISGAEPGDGEMTDLAAVFEGLVALMPWAWATLGAYAVVATPLLGLLVTAWEYWSVGDRRTVWLAAAVIAVLAASVVVAILR
jgi:uncharacterized membrane protein